MQQIIERKNPHGRVLVSEENVNVDSCTILGAFDPAQGKLIT
jgi:hypothetical protein